MTLENALSEYRKTIDAYKATPFDNLDQNAELMKDMAIILSFVSSHKVKYRQQWNAKVFGLRDEMSITAAEKVADEEIPELAMLRELIRAGNNILDVMRSHVSLLKNEQ